MAIEHIQSALNFKAGKSSLKLLLLCVANLASAVDNCFYPSIAYLEEKTELNRKTIIAGLQQLEELGVIKDTGGRKGSTNQIVIYEYILNSSNFGTVPISEQFQKRTAKSTKNGRKESQKRYTETKEETKDEIYNSLRSLYNARKALIDEGISEQVVDDWLAHRKKLRATVTKTVVDSLRREADKAGMMLEDVLRVMCRNGWRGFSADWVKKDDKKSDSWGAYFSRGGQDVIDIKSNTLQLG